MPKIDPATLSTLDALYLGSATIFAGVHSPRVRPSISAPSSPMTPMPFADHQRPDGPIMVTARSPGFAGTFPSGSEKYRTVGDENSVTIMCRMANILPGRE